MSELDYEQLVGKDPHTFIGEHILNEVWMFRKTNLTADTEKADMTVVLGKLLGINLELKMIYERPKLTPEEEKAIEDKVGRAWDAAREKK